MGHNIATISRIVQDTWGPDSYVLAVNRDKVAYRRQQDDSLYCVHTIGYDPNGAIFLYHGHYRVDRKTAFKLINEKE